MDTSRARPRRALSRVLLALAALLAALLVAEGLASVFAGRLLFTPALRALVEAPTGTPGNPADRGPLTDAARAAAAAGNLGLYRAHPDPLVGYTLRTNAELDILDGHVRSDGLGLRRRTGPAPPRDALRVVVLGDSVAFGFGLDDEDALAQQLEDLLAGTRDPLPAGQRAVVCRTVAIPGWNHRNAVRFLLDHMDELEPDIVLYLPVGNDLMDTDGVNEHSLRRPAPDIAQSDPWLSVYQGIGLAWLKPALKGGASDAAAVALLGTSALAADISPESSRRYGDNVVSIALMADRLAHRDARLLLVQYIEGEYGWHLRERLLAALPDVPQLALFSGVPPEFMLPNDPHPNAATVRVMARWIAEDLLARGWITRGAGRPLPDVDAAYSEHRAMPPAPQAVAETCEVLRVQARAALRSVLDWSTAEGLLQVFGGLNADGSVGSRLRFIIARPETPAAFLELELAPVPGRPDLAPLHVGVEVDGARVGEVVIGADGPVKARLPLPPAMPETPGGSTGSPAPLEVSLVPERWVVANVRGTDAPVSFVPRRIACVPP